MIKLKQTILMLCLVLFGTLCHAGNVTKAQKRKTVIKFPLN